MITIKYDKHTAGITQIEDRLKDMVLGYEIKQSKKYTTVILVEGDDKVKGFTAIHKYLDGIQGELKQWWYCDC